MRIGHTGGGETAKMCGYDDEEEEGGSSGWRVTNNDQEAHAKFESYSTT